MLLGPINLESLDLLVTTISDKVRLRMIIPTAPHRVPYLASIPSYLCSLRNVGSLELPLLKKMHHLV